MGRAGFSIPVFFLIALLFSQSFSQGYVRCATLAIAENKSKKLNKKTILSKSCVIDAKVESRKTKHFQIFYTKTGVHGIDETIHPRYIDSLATYLEDAYKFHTSRLGMQSISGAKITHQFNEKVDDNLYPVEVINMCKMCDFENDEQTCGSVGATFSPTNDKPTQLVIKNDFSNLPRLEWHDYLKITVYHELYHSFQLTQYTLDSDYRKNSFWLEASATGVEDITIPKANDYIYYLSSNNFQQPRYFKIQEKPMEDRSIDLGYAHVTLYLFLYSKLGEKFDSEIWTKFSQDSKKQKNFSEHLHDLLTEKGINSEDLFHEYAEAMYFSGSNAPKALEPFSNDMRQWPEWRIFANNSPKTLPAGAIDYVMTAPNETPNVDSAKMTVIDENRNKIWALSRLLNLTKEDTEFAAYPNPWNPSAGTKRIRFKGLGENHKGVEIRAANGALIGRVYEDFWEPKKNIAPGILYYRKLPYGKNKVLIVRY